MVRLAFGRPARPVVVRENAVVGLEVFRAEADRPFVRLSFRRRSVHINDKSARLLEHSLEHAFILCRGHTVRKRHLPRELRQNVVSELHVAEIADAHDSKEILQASNHCRWNKAKAARLLGISRPTLYQRIRHYGITPSSE